MQVDQFFLVDDTPGQTLVYQSQKRYSFKVKTISVEINFKRIKFSNGQLFLVLVLPQR